MSGSGTEEQAGRRAAFSLQWQMLVGFLIGLTAGLVAYAVNPGAPWIDAVTRYLTGPIGQVFLRLLFMLVIPLLVSALIVGIAEMGEMRSLRRVGLRTLIYTLIVSGIAVVISLALVNLLQPGSGVDPAQARALLADAGQGAKAILDRGADTPTGMQALIAIIPDNVIAAMADNDILAVMVFALFFGIGLVLVQTKDTKLLLDAMEGLFAVTMRLISIVIRLAPIAIACFMFNLAAQFGWDLLLRLSAYVGVVLLALAIQMFGIYSLLIGLLARRSPLRFFAAVQEASVMAFATASSNATLPTAIRVAEENLHLPRRIARFVLTIGATANQNGDAGLHIGRSRHGRCAGRVAAGGGDDPGDGRHPARGDRAGAGRRPAARHVPHRAQRHRRPCGRDGDIGARGDQRCAFAASAHQMSVSAKPAKPRSSAAPPSPLGWAFSSSVCWIWPTLSRSGITAMPMADSVTVQSAWLLTPAKRPIE